MATIIWCDRVKHVVEESRSQIEDMVHHALSDVYNNEGYPSGFIYVGVKEIAGRGGQQRALNVRHITSYEAFPGDPV